LLTCLLACLLCVLCGRAYVCEVTVPKLGESILSNASWPTPTNPNSTTFTSFSKPSHSSVSCNNSNVFLGLDRSPINYLFRCLSWLEVLTARTTYLPTSLSQKLFSSNYPCGQTPSLLLPRQNLEPLTPRTSTLLLGYNIGFAILCPQDARTRSFLDILGILILSSKLENLGTPIHSDRTQRKPHLEGSSSSAFFLKMELKLTLCSIIA